MNMDLPPNYRAGNGKLYGLTSSGMINSRIIFFSDLVSFHWQGQDSRVLKCHAPIGTMLLYSMQSVY